MTLKSIEEEFDNQFPKNAFWILDCDLANKEKERVMLFLKSQITKALEEVVPEEWNKIAKNKGWFEGVVGFNQCRSQILENIQKFLNN